MSDIQLNALIETFHDTLPKEVATMAENIIRAKVQELEADLKLLHKHLGTDTPISSLKADAIEEMAKEKNTNIVIDCECGVIHGTDGILLTDIFKHVAELRKSEYQYDKGEPLTEKEIDDNLSHLREAKDEKL